MSKPIKTLLTDAIQSLEQAKTIFEQVNPDRDYTHALNLEKQNDELRNENKKLRRSLGQYFGAYKRNSKLYKLENDREKDRKAGYTRSLEIKAEVFEKAINTKNAQLIAQKEMLEVMRRYIADNHLEINELKEANIRGVFNQSN